MSLNVINRQREQNEKNIITIYINSMYFEL